MKRILSSLAVLGVACVAASAADLPARSRAPLAPLTPPATIATWNGAYVGLNVGGGWFSRGSGSGVIGGGQIGYNYRISPLFVVGLESDLQGSSIRGPQFAPFASHGVGWLGTVRGRFGVTALSPNLLLYGTGGFAYGGLDRGFGSSVATGWTGGAGVEWMFHPGWSAKLEYLYTDLSRGGAFDPAGFPHPSGAHIHTVRAGVNYHFDLFGAAPVAAKF